MSTKISFASFILAPGIVIGAAISDGDPVSSLFSVTALIIVLGGTLCALVTQFGPSGVFKGIKGVGLLLKSSGVDLHDFLERSCQWAQLLKTSGNLALESHIDDGKSELEKLALRLLVDTAKDHEFIRKLNELNEEMTDEERVPGAFWEAAGGYMPTIGVMGAVLGLIHVMLELNHPELLGAGIATAFVATIYGVGFANLMCLPIGGHLANIAHENEKKRDVVVTIFLLIKSGMGATAIRAEMASKIPAKNSDAAKESTAPGLQGMEQTV